MQLITLTSDMGIKDHYLASMKGAIYSASPSIQIVDISHSIVSFSTTETAYCIAHCFESFPIGTIHIIAVNSEPMINLNNEELSYLPSILLFKGHYFIGTDNGIFSLLVQNEVFEGFWRIDNVLSNKNIFIFPAKNILAPAACKLANGIAIETFCSVQAEFQRATAALPITEPNVIKGSVIQIDHFGNIITNISKEIFYSFGENTPFTIYFRKVEYCIDEISSSYTDVPHGEKLAIFNSDNYLEIAVNHGSLDRKNGASTLFGISLKDTIRIEFTPPGSRATIESLFL